MAQAGTDYAGLSSSDSIRFFPGSAAGFSQILAETLHGFASRKAAYHGGHGQTSQNLFPIKPL